MNAQQAVAWLVKWTMKQSGPYASAYLSEDEAHRAAANVRTYAHATDVEIMPVYALEKEAKCLK